MGICARVVADSISPAGKRITTFVLYYPRYIHAEFMTHRVMSRNAASSRAIPAKRIRQNVKLDMAEPIFWGHNKSGMSASEELNGWRLIVAKLLWKFSCYLMLFVNWLFEKLELHKQIANRILEPFFNITVIVTATELSNFFALRIHKDAQPEIRALAEAMLEALNLSVPAFVPYNNWHLPYLTNLDRQEMTLEEAIKVSVARCCRVSYLNHEGKKATLEEDLKLYERLVGSFPKHMSPCEHQAIPLEDPKAPSGNFYGWAQYRKFIPNENIK